VTFLAPAAGLIGAAIALPVLVVFYLLKLRRRPVRVSSTLLWQRATHDLQVNAPLRWLRASLLLLIQLLALGAFLAALARPAISTGGVDAARVVIVIDRSASMSAADGAPSAGSTPPAAPDTTPPTRLDQARRLAEPLANQLARAGGRSPVEIMVVALAAEAVTVCPFTSSPGAAAEAIRTIQPTDQPARLATLARLIRALGHSPEAIDESAPPSPTIVYVLSDGAIPDDDGAEHGPPAAPGVEIRLVRVGPPPPPPPPPPSPPAPIPATAAQADVESSPSSHPPLGRDNLGLVAINARRDYADPALVRIFARVLNALDQPVDAPIELRIDGRPEQVRLVRVPPLSRATSGAVEPGEVSLTFEVVRSYGGLATVAILRPDLLASDNTASILLLPPRRPAVLAVGPGDSAARPGAPPGGLDPFLLSALQELDLARLAVVDRQQYEALAADLGPAARAPGAAAALASFDLVIFDRVAPAAAPPIPTLSFGSAPPIAGVTVVRPEVPAGSPPPVARFLAWQRTHPVMRDVGLDPVIISPPMSIAVDPARVAGVTVLAQGPDGPLIALVEDGRVRRLVVAFEIARTNWGPDVSFPVFMANAVEFLALGGQASAGRAYTTTDPITVAPDPAARELAVSGPISLTITPPPGADPAAAAPVTLGPLERAGVYTVRGAAPPDQVLAVNLADAAESRLGTADWSPRGVAAGAAAQADSPGSGAPREIWHWFVIAGLALATLEWLLYAWRMRA
jgi:hypothetical protein